MFFLLRTFFQCLKPLLKIYIVLQIYVLYQHKFKENTPLPESKWLDELSSRERSTILDNRKSLLIGLKEVISGYEDQHFVATRFSEDIVWEDPFQRSEGLEEVTAFLGLAKYCKDLQFQVFHEIHFEKEILMDWHVTFTPIYLYQHPITIPMRSHIHLQKKDGIEQVIKVVEDWGGNPPLNEENCINSVLGSVQQLSRRVVGYLTHKTIYYLRLFGLMDP